ncbi:MAG TPA: MXAN_5187 C-terminal domain-containing protein [Acidobacteriota bacterium]|nr:MXAN_5187 C-terminal domain-containing protein [Acidobacteriota bacterium]
MPIPGKSNRDKIATSKPVTADTRPLDKELDDLERSINQLKREMEIYLAGATKLPPLGARDKLERTVRKLSGDPNMSQATRFRYNTLAGRFNTYLDLWNKQLKLKEEGKSPIRSGVFGGPTQKLGEEAYRTEPIPSKAAEPKPAAASPFQKVYNDYLSKRLETGEQNPRVSLESFEKTLAKQREAILQKHQCKDVEFYVSVEEGRTKLKAKPVR